MSEVLISQEEVNKIFMWSLFEREETLNGEPIDGIEMIEVKAASIIIGFHKERLLSCKEEISKMIDNLPDMTLPLSFLSLCNDKEKNQWTDFHKYVEQLTAMALGCELIKELPGTFGLCPYYIKVGGNIESVDNE